MTDDEVNSGGPAGTDRDDSEPLGRLDDYEVADGYPDVRGWRVATPDDRGIGTVRELLVDTDRLEVRYLVVTLERSAEMAEMNAPGGDVRVPITSVRVDTDANQVVADPSAFRGALGNSLGGGPSASTGNDAGAPPIEESEIRVPVVEEELVIRTRQVTEQHEVEADVRRERADIERNP
jgi:hypothetical protein